MIVTKGHDSVFSASRYKIPTHIVGCGGMGTAIATALVRMGVGRHESPITLYDHDFYEEHNLANQSITRRSVGQEKVFGLRKELRAIEPRVNIHAHPYRVGSGFGDFNLFHGVVFLCLDDMVARNEIVRYFLSHNPRVKCVIETRMDARVGISHCFDPRDQKHLDCWWLYWNYPGESENAMGCDGYQSIISAIYGTSTLALRQFEHFAHSRTTTQYPNRVYEEFDTGVTDREIWPTAA